MLSAGSYSIHRLMSSEKVGSVRIDPQTRPRVDIVIDAIHTDVIKQLSPLIYRIDQEMRIVGPHGNAAVINGESDQDENSIVLGRIESLSQGELYVVCTDE